MRTQSSNGVPDIRFRFPVITTFVRLDQVAWLDNPKRQKYHMFFLIWFVYVIGAAFFLVLFGGLSLLMRPPKDSGKKSRREQYFELGFFIFLWPVWTLVVGTVFIWSGIGWVWTRRPGRAA